MAGLWKARHYREDDGPQIETLLQSSFHHNISMNRWHWILDNNPLGSRTTDGDVWIAESDGKIVGHYAKIRYTMKYFRQEVVGAQGVWMATHPKYRRLGIATELMRCARADSKMNGTKVHFSFPNSLSYRLASKHGVAFCGNLKKLVLVFERRRYLQKALGRRAGSIAERLGLLSSESPGFGRPSEGLNEDYSIEEGFRADAGEVWDSVKSNFDLGIERSLDYLNWRYNKRWGDYVALSAIRNGRTAGYLVGRTTDSGGVRSLTLCEILSKDDEEATYIVLEKALLNVARRAGAAFISAFSSPLPGCNQAMSGSGFVDARISPVFGRKAVTPGLYLFDEKDRLRVRQANYFYSPGDSDFA